MVSKVHFAHWHWQLSPLPFLEKLTCWSQGGRFTHQLEWFKYISLLFTRFELNDIPLADTTILVRRILRTRMGLHKIQVVCLWLSGRLGEETGWLKRRSPTLTEHTSNIAQILSIIPDVSMLAHLRFPRDSFVSHPFNVPTFWQYYAYQDIVMAIFILPPFDRLPRLVWWKGTIKPSLLARYW